MRTVSPVQGGAQAAPSNIVTWSGRAGAVARVPAPTGAASAPLASAWLAQLVIDTSPEALSRKLAEFRAAVDDALTSASNDYRVLKQLEEVGLDGCESCVVALRQRLAAHPHYRVLLMLREAERMIGTGGPPRSP